VTRQAERTPFDLVMEVIESNGLTGMAEIMRILLNTSMSLERDRFLGAGPHERTPERRGYANGFKPKSIATRVGEIEVAVPQVRDVADGAAFYPSSLERGTRAERAFKLSIAEMYVSGVSTRKVAAVTQELCGFEVSSASVSRASALLDAELSKWRSRPLGCIHFLLLDARYEKVRHGGAVISCAVLIAIGIDESGHRSILGVSVNLSEAEVHWRSFLESLQARGLHGVRLITSDDHAGIKAALNARFPGTPWQRCQFHLQQNAGAYVPKVDMREEVARDIRAAFDAPDRAEADRRVRLAVDKYRESAPALSAWIESNIPEGLTVFTLPPSHRRKLRTSNLLECLNKEIRRRTRVATLFPNEASLLRLVSAVLVEFSEDWETGKVYLTPSTA
jgi:putative transposase